jgi:Cdc6-like AAA superfamily ATPase
VVVATKEGVKQLIQRQDDQARQEILDWFSPINYATQQSDFLSRCQEGTGQWLLEADEFQQWMYQKKQTLFCPGMPGAGKTILTSVIIDHLEQEFGNEPNTGIAYLYCNFRQHHEQTTQDLLASLLKQLIQGQPVIPPSVEGLFDHHKRKGTRPKLEELTRSIHSVAALYSTVFLVVDALDECRISDGSRNRLLSEIFNLQGKYNINFLATSRHPDITVKFEGSPRLEIRASTADVERYLKSRILQLPSFVSRRPEIQHEIISEILRAVDGMYVCFHGTYQN